MAIIDQQWINEHKETLLKILEADFDPHLKRVDPNSLKFISEKQQQQGDLILEVDSVILEYGGCSGVSCETPERRRIKIITGEEPLQQRLIALL